jgi:hypothetical protein
MKNRRFQGVGISYIATLDKSLESGREKSLIHYHEKPRPRLVAKGTKSVDRYSLAREKYRPDRIRLLLVAESPPSSGGYFYFRKTIGKDHLFRETMKALELWPQSQKMGKGIDKTPYLDQFMTRKFFLIDTCKNPVDKLPQRAKLMQIAKKASILAGRVHDLDPEKIIIIKKTVFGPVRKALMAAGLADRILNEMPIPFPSHGHQSRFQIEFRRLTQTFEEKPS